MQRLALGSCVFAIFAATGCLLGDSKLVDDSAEMSKPQVPSSGPSGTSTPGSSTGPQTAAAGSGARNQQNSTTAGMLTVTAGISTGAPPPPAAMPGKPATATAGMVAPTTGAGGNVAANSGTSTAGGSGASAPDTSSTSTSGGGGGSSAPTSGTSMSSGGASGGAAMSSGATFTKVFEEVLTGTGCAVSACHGSSSAWSKLGLSDKADAYMGLVGVKAMGTPAPGTSGGGCSGMDFVRVKPGDPDNSLIVQKLEKKQKCGMEMPPGGTLKPDSIKLVRDWIMDGAKNN